MKLLNSAVFQTHKQLPFLFFLKKRYSSHIFHALEKYQIRKRGMQSRRAGRCLGLKQDWQVTRKTIERPLFFMFSLSRWRALHLVSSLQNFALSGTGGACAEFISPQTSSATSSSLVTLFTWSPDESLPLSLSRNLCPIFKNKYNTNKRSLDYSHHPRTDATTLESTTTKISKAAISERP